MQLLLEELENREMELNGWLSELDRHPTDAGQGSLRITNVKGRPSYYLIVKDPLTQQTSKKYIRKSDIRLARELAQATYEKKVRKKIIKQISLIKEFRILR